DEGVPGAPPSPSRSRALQPEFAAGALDSSRVTGVLPSGSSSTGTVVKVMFSGSTEAGSTPEQQAPEHPEPSGYLAMPT
ncbi:hypothetical protein ABT218_32290, partial [Streptomyces sp. NPDC001455]|uniref:hypothetical protein n=1 Tax=Streptomyces sp. NPDC001455 TaxID=3154518 RepID=UPI003316D3BA